MTIVRNQMTDAQGKGTAGWVMGRLVGPGFRPGSASEVTTQATEQTDADGNWQLDLVPNSVEAPFYVISEQGADYRTVQHVVAVPQSDTPVWLGDVEVQVPLPIGRADAVYVGPPGPPGPQGDPGPQGPPGYSDEQVRDVMAAALVAGAGITLTVDDAGDTITITSSGGGGGGPVTAAGLPAGSVMYVLKPSGGSWPARPTARTDVLVIWKGASPGPATSDGYVDGVDEWHQT